MAALPPPPHPRQPAAAQGPFSQDNLITLKLQYGSDNKRTKLPFKDLKPGVLPAKLRSLLNLPVDQDFAFERFSDSAGKWIKLDDNTPAVYKQLERAAKAKLKLRMRITTVADTPALVAECQNHTQAQPQPQPEPLIDVNSLNMADLSLCSQANPTIERAMAMAMAREQHRQLQEQPVLHDLAAINQTINSVHDNIALDYRMAFGSTMPPFPSIDPEPCMPRYPSPPFNAFSVCCNKCNFAILDHHWHCGTCREGDFDLCQGCLDSGSHCDVPDHFLVKRTLEDGKIISSTTETVSKSKPSTTTQQQTPVNQESDSFDGKNLKSPMEQSLFRAMACRTCNSCLAVHTDCNFVTCQDCSDYDLCFDCMGEGTHGHNPAHKFTSADGSSTLSAYVAAACAPGRGQVHSAICDGCDNKIIGIRHKCLDCPDWDYCSDCHKSAPLIHAGHRFAPLYKPLEYTPKSRESVHHGICCDGPLCGGENWIRGDRYKCAVCDDTDFCASCEALPTNPHNRTHPLLKFKTPVRNVNITTHEECENGEVTSTFGDRSSQNCSRGTETAALAPSVNASTQASELEKEVKEKQVETKEAVSEKPAQPKALPLPEAVKTTLPDAYYMRDYVPDGTMVRPGAPIFQTWTMYNPSGQVWPVGCALRWVGGDSMLDVDTDVPGSISVFEKAASSNSTLSEVYRGSEYSFSVRLRAPEKLGRAVSYWRLYTPEGTPFGHRLWCEVDVVAEIAATEPAKIEEKKKQEDEAKPTQETEEISESQMVFPKLDKESPASSVHLVSREAGHAAATTAKETDLSASLDDILSVTVDDDESSDDGFLTDEDYDMVDDAQR